MTSIDLRVRTQSSEQYSFSGYDLTVFDHSFQSVSYADQAVSLFIQTLKKSEEKKAKERHTISSRSHSYILVNQQEVQEKPKYKSMKKGKHLFLQLIPGQVMSQLLGYHRCLNLAKNQVYNRAYGAMFGFAIGDALGAHIINKPFSQLQINQALLMPGGGVMNLKSGQCTDELEICLALSEALINGKGRYDQNLVAQKYLQWLDSQPFDLPVLMGIAFGQIRKKRRQNGVLNFSTLGEQLIAGSLRNVKQESNLGLIRLIPLVIWSLGLEEYQFNRLITEQMRLITPNAFVRESALVYANMLRCILTTGDVTLAFHQAAYHICNFGSQQMIELWKCVEENCEPMMTTSTSKHLKLPFIYAVNELLELDSSRQDSKKQFIQSAVRILSKGFNTDTNCSIVLGLIGAAIGYNSIPSFFRSKIINSSPYPSKKRSRDYHSRRIIELVDQLLTQGAVEIHAEPF